MTRRAGDRTVPESRCKVVPVLSMPDTPTRAARVARGAAAWRDGMRAEQAACRALEADGWTILCRRARTEAGEIDIVACRQPDRMTAFVEVKTRPSLEGAARSLTTRQQARLCAAAELLLARNPDWPQEGLRFDLLLVDRAGAVRRIADAFRYEG
jgi:putative endonuclease